MKLVTMLTADYYELVQYVDPVTKGVERAVAIVRERKKR